MITRTYTLAGPDGRHGSPLTHEQLRALIAQRRVTGDTEIRDQATGETFRVRNYPPARALFRELGIPLDPAPGPVLKPAPPVAPVAPPPSAPAPIAPVPSGDTVLAEATWQYVTLNRWQAFGAVAITGLFATLFGLPGIVFGLLITIFGVAMLIYAVIAKNSLRQSVAQRGHDAAAWARPLDAAFLRTIGIALGALVVLVLVAGTLYRLQRASLTDSNGRLDYAHASSYMVLDAAQQCPNNEALFDRLGPATGQDTEAGRYLLYYRCADGHVVTAIVNAYDMHVLRVVRE